MKDRLAKRTRKRQQSEAIRQETTNADSLSRHHRDILADTEKTAVMDQCDSSVGREMTVETGSKDTMSDSKGNSRSTQQELKKDDRITTAEFTGACGKKKI